MTGRFLAEIGLTVLGGVLIFAAAFAAMHGHYAEASYRMVSGWFVLWVSEPRGSRR